MGSGNPVYPVLAGFIKTNKKLDFSYKTRWMKLPFKKVLGKIPSVPKKTVCRVISRADFIPVDQYGHPKKCPQKTKS